MSVHVRRLELADRDSFAAFVERALARGDLAASSAPDGHWMVQMAFQNPDHNAVAMDDAGIVGIVLPETKALVVEPGRRRQGIGRRLVDAAVEIERERGRADVIMGVPPEDAHATAFVAANGFAYHSTVWDLELPADHALGEVRGPDGYVVRPFRRTTDVDGWVDLFNLAFADHPTPLQLDRDVITQGLDDPGVRDVDLILLEAPDGTLAGFCATEPRFLDDGTVVPRAEIWTIGVRPGLQGHGLGRSLLRLGVAHLRSEGVATVALSVNGRNPRALALYESEGFIRTATRDRWTRPLAPSAAP